MTWQKGRHFTSDHFCAAVNVTERTRHEDNFWNLLTNSSIYNALLWLLVCNFSHPMEVWSRCQNLILCWPHLNTCGWIFMLAKMLYLMLMHQGLKLQFAPPDFKPSHKKIKWSWVGIKLLWGADLMLQGPDTT